MACFTFLCPIELKGHVVMKSLRCFLLLFCCLSSSYSVRSAEEATAIKKQPNVLLICIDDLRPELGYSVPNGNHHISTPNVDALAAKSMIFDRAYVQQGVSVRLATMLVFRLLLTQTTRDVRGNRIGVRPHAEQLHDFPSPRHHARVELSD